MFTVNINKELLMQTAKIFDQIQFSVGFSLLHFNIQTCECSMCFMFEIRQQWVRVRDRPGAV